MSRLIGWVGGLLTAAYLALLAYLVKDRLRTLDTMDLNEVGDFLAGAFGPLAILWLILGFFQQGVELRQNSAALRLQADELRNSVEQQERLADIAREQMEDQRAAFKEEMASRFKAEADLKRRAQPIFNFFCYGHSGQLPAKDFVFVVRNDGPEMCTSISFSVMAGGASSFHLEKLIRGEPAEKTISVNFGEKTELRARVFVTFTDGMGERGKLEFFAYFSPSTALIVSPSEMTLAEMM